MQNDNVKIKEKLDQALAKLYMPSQDKVLGGLNSEGMAHNVIKGVQQ
jgi:hypothetical protein